MRGQDDRKRERQARDGVTRPAGEDRPAVRAFPAVGINPAFDPRTYGHSKLITLLQSFSDIFEVKADNRNPPVYYIEYIDKKTEDKIDGVVTRWFPYPKYGFIKTENGDYYFHMSNIENYDKSQKIEAGQKVKLIEFQAPNPNGLTESERNGKANKVFFLPIQPLIQK